MNVARLPGTTETNPELALRAFLPSEMCIQTSDNWFATLERQLTVARSVGREVRPTSLIA